jgi:MFS family permease
VRILRPLRHADFALLWTGMTVSLLGDGIYAVALAWQVYELSADPAAFALVGVAWTVPQVALALLGGVVTDRFERRRVMIVGDLLRCGAVTTIAALSFAGELRVWHLFALVAVFGAGSALFNPAFTAIVPELLGADLLVAANSLDQVARPLAARFAGPVLGGSIVGLWGASAGFLADAISFVVSIAALLLISPRARPATAAARPSILAEVGEGVRFVRSQPWLLGTILSSSLGMLFFLGPIYVLVPFLVKLDLDGSAADLGLVLAAGGCGAIGVSLVLGQRDLPRRPVSTMLLTWAAAGFLLAGYGIVDALWEVVVLAAAGTALLVAGQILWSTLLQRFVPGPLLGRVSSLDWLVSFGLVPVSYALTGPVAALLGVHTTFLVAGLACGGILLSTLLFFPGVRDVEAVVPVASPAPEPASSL